MSLSFDEIRALAGDRLGIHDTSCPLCGPACKSLANQRRPVFRIWWEEDAFARYKCARCDAQGFAHGSSTSAKPRSSPMPAKAKPDDAKRREQALTIWDDAKPIEGTPAETYLRSRGLAYDGNALRWHGNCPFGRDRVGAMVALVRDIHTNAPQAIHRTAIASDGRKLSHLGSNGRLALGPIGGGAIKLTDDDAVSLVLGIGEGIESTLSIRNLPDMPTMPVWSLLAANQLAAFPVLGGVEALWIAVDHDESGTGQQASKTTARRWAAAGREAFLVTPVEPGADLNDIGGRDGEAA